VPASKTVTTNVPTHRATVTILPATVSANRWVGPSNCQKCHGAHRNRGVAEWRFVTYDDFPKQNQAKSESHLEGFLRSGAKIGINDPPPAQADADAAGAATMARTSQRALDSWLGALAANFCRVRLPDKILLPLEWPRQDDRSYGERPPTAPLTSACGRESVTSS